MTKLEISLRNQKMELFTCHLDLVGYGIWVNLLVCVMLSFITVLETSMMEETKMQLILSVFRRFPQYDFIWKWETEEMKDKPDNLLLSKWLPQMEILAHPNTKLFISLLGQSSFQESLCHQKQVVR